MNWKKHSNIRLAVCLLVMTLAVPAGAVTHYVFEGQSIQAAIDDANDGDEIQVEPGTYNEAINFIGKAVRLYSSDGPGVTTINGNSAKHVVQCVSGEGPNTILEGFTIMNGNATGSGGPDFNGGGMLNSGSSPTVTNCVFQFNAADYGGGMYNGYGSNPTVTNCTFQNNTARVWGAGMFNNLSEPTVSGCTFTNNTANWDGGGMFNGQSSPTVTDCNFINNIAQHSGGGMYSKDDSNPTVINCIFTGNTAASYGGGMSNNSSSPTVTNCTFSNNSATGAGGGMHNDWSSPTISNCRFTANSANGMGGGIGSSNCGSGTVTDCTFSDNTAADSGGGMFNVTGCSWTVTNCTFTGNTAINNGGAMHNYQSEPILTNCILWGDSPTEISGSATVTYSDVEGVWGGTGNIAADPLFVDAAGGDLRLSSDASPCVDAGDNSAANLPSMDLAGNPRIVDGDRDGTATVDMGAFEFQTWLIHNINKDQWYETIQAAIDDANDGDQIEVGPGTYYEAINFNGRAVRLYSSGGPDVTTINGDGAYHVVQCVSGEGPGTILEGFTITGGNANGAGNYSGGGMLNRNNSSPTVTNCNFSGNSADYDGGGIYNNNSSPTVTNCNFSGNTADYGGGGMGNQNNSNPVVTNCTFSGNTAYGGGGMGNENNSNPVMTNCTFSGNTAPYGGGMYNYISSPIVTNCILWNDTPDEIYNNSSTPTVTYSDVKMSSGTFPGTGNINADPLFVDAAGGDLRLTSDASPCVDTGTNGAPGLPATDLAGNPRVVDGDRDDTAVVDMGAYEFQTLLIHNINKDQWYETIQVAIDDANDGDHIEVGPGTYTEAINFSGKKVRLYSSGGAEVTTINGNGAYHVVQCISGETANTILEGFTITGGDANGTDPNDRGAGMYNNNSSPTVTNCTFSGNYAAGSGGGMFNYQSSPTVTGCKYILNQTDFHGGGIYNQLCSPRVINCVFSQNMAAVHGGGMMNNDYSYPTVVKCTFSQNTAGASGGGMTNSWFSSSTVTNCTFTNNTATAGGGGIYLYASSPTVTDCNFSGNTAYSGGGIFNEASSPIVTDCNFSKNTAQSFAGGGMYNHTGSNPIVTNCSFTGNTAANDGGGIYNVDSSPTITNCTFSGNSVYYCGGGIYNLNSSSPFVTNCTFFGNSVSYGGGSYGGGMYNKNSSNPTVTNCIFWNDLNSEIRNIDSSPIFTYSDIQGGTGQVWFGAGCIDADPCFVDAGSGNFNLKIGSPCIDVGDNNAVPSSVLKDLAGKLRFADDPCTTDTGDAGTTGRPVVDMGAYEYQGCGTTSQNLLANPGFETGDATGWITNWGFGLTADTNQVHDGNYSGLASGRTASWQGAWQSLLGLMDDGKTYRISGWVRLQSETSDYVALTVKKVDSTGDHYYGIDNATAYSDKWVNLDGTLIFDANESMTDLYIYFEGPAPDVNFYVDDAAVTEVMGDMNHNGGVDFIDFSLFASYYGFDCSTQDCGRANLDDSDNTINERDLAILAGNWLAGTEP